MRYTLLILIFSLGFSACTKDKFDTTPQIKINNVNTTELHPGQILRFTIKYTDKEGDLQDSIYVQQFSANCPNTFFEQVYPLPAFPTTGNAEGEMEVSLGYRVQNYPSLREPQCDVTDTCYFRFMLKDEAQNRSDTITSEPIYLFKD